MTVAVFFADGVVKNVPSQLKAISTPEGHILPLFEQVPLNCDPIWKYEQVDGRWMARRRVRQVATLHPPVEEWWRSITQMADDLPDARQLSGEKIEQNGSEDSRQMRSAA